MSDEVPPLSPSPLSFGNRAPPPGKASTETKTKVVAQRVFACSGEGREGSLEGPAAAGAGGLARRGVSFHPVVKTRSVEGSPASGAGRAILPTLSDDSDEARGIRHK